MAAVMPMACWHSASVAGSVLMTAQTENFLILTLSEWPPSAQARLSDGKTLKFHDFVKLLI
jgi:hypothetical protein